LFSMTLDEIKSPDRRRSVPCFSNACIDSSASEGKQAVARAKNNEKREIGVIDCILRV
jgi:hypothetical protein